MQILFLIFVLSAITIASVKGTDIEWIPVKNEIRMPLELRVVNEGLAHDDKSWFMTNQHFLYRTSLYPLNIEVANHHAIPEELVKLRYNHIGDIDHDQGIIYGGMETSGSEVGILGAWNATDLTMIKYVYTEQKGLPWVAVNPSTRSLYANVWNQVDGIQIYDMDSFALKGKLTPAAGQTFPKEIQGGAFNPLDPGFLYVAINANCSVYKIDLLSGDVTFILSDEYNTTVPHVYEMEGITFWDLRKHRPDLGVMHLFGNFMSIKEKSIRSFTTV